MSDSINEGFIGKLSTLMCSICAEIPTAEVVQCQNGHSMCIQCSEKIVRTYPSTCPTCRAVISQVLIRNYYIETVLDAITFNCPNKDGGCDKKLNRREIPRHSITCKFG